MFDSLMPVFYNLPPSLWDSELDLRLPCDSELWEAPDAYRWAQLALAYPGSPCTLLWATSARANIQGESLKTILTDMFNPVSTLSTPLNRFGSFVIIHALFRAIHRSKSNDYQAQLSIQHALTQWYINRLAIVSGSGTAQSPSCAPTTQDFTSCALALYWLAQLNFAASVPMCHVGPENFKRARMWLKGFWSVLHEAGEVGAGIRLAGVPDTSVGCPLVEEMPDEQELENNADAGLLEWIPHTYL